MVEKSMSGPPTRDTEYLNDPDIFRKPTQNNAGPAGSSTSSDTAGPSSSTESCHQAVPATMRSAVPESADSRRALLRDLIRVMRPEVVTTEIDSWLKECGPAGAAIRQVLSSPNLDPRAQRNALPPEPYLPQRDGMLEALRQRNMVASNVVSGIHIDTCKQ